MKNSKLILCAVSLMTLSLAACAKPNMTFDEAVDSVTHSEIYEMMADAEYYQQSFDISTNFAIPESILDENIEGSVSFSTDSKTNVKDSEWETNLSLKLQISKDWDEWKETVKMDWDAAVKYLSNGIYFTLKSLDIDGPEGFDKSYFNLDWIEGQRFSFELTEKMLEEIKSKLPEDLDFDELYNEENLKKIEKDLEKFKGDLKKAIVNEGALVYSGIYSEFDGYNAYQFSIDKEKAFKATTDYIKTFIPDEYMDDYVEAIEEVDLDEVFEDFPLTNFVWYLVITWKDRVQVVIENLDIEDYYSTVKTYGTFGRDRYELVVKEDWDDVFLFSAKLNRAHYDVLLKVEDMEILKWTITPRKSHWKISIDFDLAINIELDEKISIPFEWSWIWKEISKFNVEKPANSKNLLEDIMWEMLDEIDFEDIDPDAYQALASYRSLSKSMTNQNLGTPVVVGWIMVASLMPRMQSAQSRARDVARKNDLSQIQTAIVTSQQDKWRWPGIFSGATKWMPTSAIEKELLTAGLSSVPTDPVQSNINYWLGKDYEKDSALWDYLYLVAKRNWTSNWGFVLMAKTEIEWGSNRVVCKNWTWLDKWYIVNDTDLKDINVCYHGISKWNSCWINEWFCTYTDDDELRYITIY